MKISILCTSPTHPVNDHLSRWIDAHRGSHDVQLLRSCRELTGGDILFLVSCAEIVRREQRLKFRHTLVLHASALPQGRGWNPHIWEILEGATRLTVTLLEAEDEVDTGDIWHQVSIEVDRGALWDEINEAVFGAEMQLLDYGVANLSTVVPKPQRTDVAPTHYRLRNPADSRIDPERTIAEQFDLLRVCDPKRFPAFFDLRGYRYRITLEKMSDAT